MKEQLKNSMKPADSQKAELDALFANAGQNGTPQPVLGKRTRDLIDGDDDALRSLER